MLPASSPSRAFAVASPLSAAPAAAPAAAAAAAGDEGAAAATSGRGEPAVESDERDEADAPRRRPDPRALQWDPVADPGATVGLVHASAPSSGSSTTVVHDAAALPVPTPWLLHGGHPARGALAGATCAMPAFKSHTAPGGGASRGGRAGALSPPPPLSVADGPHAPLRNPIQRASVHPNPAIPPPPRPDDAVAPLGDGTTTSPAATAAALRVPLNGQLQGDCACTALGVPAGVAGNGTAAIAAGLPLLLLLPIANTATWDGPGRGGRGHGVTPTGVAAPAASTSALGLPPPGCRDAGGGGGVWDGTPAFSRSAKSGVRVKAPPARRPMLLPPPPTLLPHSPPSWLPLGADESDMRVCAEVQPGAQMQPSSPSSSLAAPWLFHRPAASSSWGGCGGTATVGATAATAGATAATSTRWTDGPIAEGADADTRCGDVAAAVAVAVGGDGVDGVDGAGVGGGKSPPASANCGTAKQWPPYSDLEVVALQGISPRAGAASLPSTVLLPTDRPSSREPLMTRLIPPPPLPAPPTLPSNDTADAAALAATLPPSRRKDAPSATVPASLPGPAP
jgi:hypothetical protein